MRGIKDFKIISKKAQNQSGCWTVTWTFGCAGHGKGTWDGLGGIVKTRRAIISKHSTLLYQVHTRFIKLLSTSLPVRRHKRGMTKWLT
jgi:hypothetical protein